MERLDTIPLDRVQDLRVRLDFGPGDELLPDGHVPHRIRGHDFAEALESCDGELLVCWVREPIGVDDWWIRGVGARDGDVSPATGCNDRRCWRDVHVGSVRCANDVVLIVASVGVEEEARLPTVQTV